MQTKRRLLFSLSLLFLFCAATAIASPAQTFTTLVNFDGTDGSNAIANLVQGTDGNFYGTTQAGGANGAGTVFKMTPGGMLTTLYSFCSQPGCADGTSPVAALVQATDGNFYGTTISGGLNGSGTVFRITPWGTLITLYSFCLQTGCPDGVGPNGLVQATDGNFYGTTTFGGGSTACYQGCGTIFKITPQGSLTTLHTFEGTDGGNSFAALVQATDGDFYGTTSDYGGPNFAGTVFKITSGGRLITIYSFCLQTPCPDGGIPFAALVQATDGNFYGTTFEGGASGEGTVFKVTPSGTLTTLHSFCSPPHCADGGYPEAGVVQATDGNFYGTTFNYGNGTVFKISPNGTLTTLHTFDGTDGRGSVAALAQAVDGNFYGTTQAGGANGFGTIFSLSVGFVLSPVQFVPLTQPCRAVDTRTQYGGDGPIQGGTFQNFAVSGAGTCGILGSAAAYSMNVSVVPQGPLGYLTVWPTGRPQPFVSTLNSLDGRMKANAAIVPAGASGEISVYATNTTNVILDINGYFAPVSGSTLAFYPLTPCRVADTRKSAFSQGLGPPYLAGNQERDFPILNATTCNIPSTAAAYSLNFAVVPHGPLGYMTVWPTGEPRPTISTLNDILGEIIANAAIVPVGTGGNVSVYPTNDTDLVIDINGYFAPAGPNGLSLYTVPLCRVIDTRKVGSGLPFSGTLSPPVDVVDSPCEPPAAAQAYVFNATVVPYGALGYLTLWPDGSDRPVVSTLNALDGSITSNMAIVPTADGKIDAYASGITQLILDISSYFAP